MINASILHCLRKLHVFSGREARASFWYYMLFVFGIAMVFNMVANVVLLLLGFGPTSLEMDPQGMPIFPFQPFIIASAILGGIVVVLAAGAVTRRLHDTNKRGWWGVLPVILLPCGLVLFSTVGMQGGRPNPKWFLLLFAVNVTYLGSLLGLILLLAKRGTVGANRFGPIPLPVRQRR